MNQVERRSWNIQKWYMKSKREQVNYSSSTKCLDNQIEAYVFAEDCIFMDKFQSYKVTHRY